MRDNIDTQDVLAQATFWSREYQLNPGDLESSIKLSAAIRKMGNPNQAIEIAQTARALFPRDPYLTAEYAAALIAAERGDEAMKPLNDGLQVAPQYARLWSLMGAAHDQAEKYDKARQYYERALQITPQDPNILANLGLSHALSGDLRTAENLLRRADSIPGAGKGVKQNLDLVLQLQNKPLTQQSATHTPAPSTAYGQQSTPSAYNAPQPPLRQSASAPQQQRNTFSTTQPSAFSQASKPYGAQSASDIARAAARNNTSRRVVVGANQPIPQRSVLDNIANSVGPKSAYGFNPYTQMRGQYAQQSQQPMPLKASPQPYPQNAAPAYPTPYSRPQSAPRYQQPLRRGPARQR